MFVEKMNITKFRSFNDEDEYEIDFSPNLNCISGHNGIGKSTILAILSNCGELKKEYGYQLNGNAFKGEYSQLIKGDKEFDRTGEVCTIYFKDIPESFDPSNPFVEDLTFRATFQRIEKNERKYIKLDKDSDLYKVESTVKEFNRYRLLPKPTEIRSTEKKLQWPTLYLGLSRLFPIGESEEAQKKSIPKHVLKNIGQVHKMILSSNDEYNNVTNVSISDTSKKDGFGIETDEYSYLANSSGQDNLGQILLGISSFENLKEKYDDYCGGIFLIDEIDATLHPAAQNKLIDYLYKKSLELNLQIFFTTHSFTLLEYLNFLRDSSRNKNKISNNYLINGRGKVEIKKNPSTDYIRTNLNETHRGFGYQKKITVVTEDEVGAWLLSKILDFKECNFISKLNIAKTSIGWTEIMKLIKNDYSTFKDILVFLDPDISLPENKSQLHSFLSGTQYHKKINKSNGNIFFLPLDKKIESIFWEYLISLPNDHLLYHDPRIDEPGLNKNVILNDGPESQHFDTYVEKEKVKEWFQENIWLIDIVFEFWAKDNEDTLNSFYKNFEQAFYQIHNR